MTIGYIVLVVLGLLVAGGLLYGAKRLVKGLETRGLRRLSSAVPSESARVVDISGNRWIKYCRGLFQLQVAA